MNTNLQKKASVNVVANNGQQKDNLPGPKKVRLVTFVIPTANLLGIKRSVLDRNEITVQVSEDSEHNIKKSINGFSAIIIPTSAHVLFQIRILMRLIPNTS